MVHQTNNLQNASRQTSPASSTPFDVMLRRQLRREGSATVSCVGFDVDTATAYLERTLLSNARQTFETHLADCRECRQHVTSLMMLNAQLVPLPVEPAAQFARPQVAAASLWSRLMKPFDEWRASLDFNWGWASAGAAMAALLLTVAVYSWRSQTPQAGMMAAKTDGPEAVAQVPGDPATAAQQEVATDAPLIAATTFAQSTSLPEIPAANNLVARNTTGNASSAPILPNLAEMRPQLPTSTYDTTRFPAPMRVLEVPEDVIALNSGKVASPSIAVTDFFSGAAGNSGLQGTPVSLGQGGSQGGSLMPVRRTSLEPHTTVNSLNLVKDQLERQSRLSELVAVDSARVASEESEQKARSNKDETSKSEPGKNETSRSRTILSTLAGQRPGLGFVAGKGEEARTKEADKTTDQPLAKPLTKRVNGHTFYFERGYWIDENYRSDTTLPLVKLVRGSERYQNFLIENPTLEQFFQLGQVIVVWKGKVYEVRK